MTLLHHQNFHHLQIPLRKVKMTLVAGRARQFSGLVIYIFFANFKR